MTDAVDVVDAKGFVATCSVQQVDHGVAVNPSGCQKHFAEGGVALGPAHEFSAAVAGFKRGLVGVGESDVLHDFSNE